MVALIGLCTAKSSGKDLYSTQKADCAAQLAIWYFWEVDIFEKGHFSIWRLYCDGVATENSLWKTLSQVLICIYHSRAFESCSA